MTRRDDLHGDTNQRVEMTRGGVQGFMNRSEPERSGSIPPTGLNLNLNLRFRQRGERRWRTGEHSRTSASTFEAYPDDVLPEWTM